MEAEKEMINGALFIDYNTVTGEPYLGIEYSGDGISVRLYVCDKQNAGQIEAGYIKAFTELKKNPRKIVGADGASIR